MQIRSVSGKRLLFTVSLPFSFHGLGGIENDVHKQMIKLLDIRLNKGE